MEDLARMEDEDTQDYVERLKLQARAFPVLQAAEPPKAQDRLTVIFQLHHEQLGEKPVDYGVRSTIHLGSDGIQADERRGIKVKKGSAITIPQTTLNGGQRQYLKVENRTGSNLPTRPTPEQSEEIQKQILLLIGGGVVLAIIRPGGFYFGEPPRGDLQLVCADGATEALATYVSIAGEE